MKPMMQRPMPRVLTVLGVVLVVGWAAFEALSSWAAHEVRERLHHAANACGARWVDADSCIIHIDLWSGELLLTGMRWRRGVVQPDHGMSITGYVDTLEIRDVSYKALLFDGKVHAAGLFVRVKDLMVQRGSASTASPKERSTRFQHFVVDDLDIRLRSTSVRMEDSIRIDLDDLAMNGMDLALDLRDTTWDAGRCEAHLSALRIAPLADSILTVERMLLSDAAQRCELHGLRFGPDDVVTPSTALALERDVVSGHFERITVEGIDPNTLMRGVLHARSIHIGPADLEVARDKSRPDPSFRHKPLPARLLRLLPPGAGCDSLIVERMSVHYHEQVDPARGFAFIPFDSIHGVLTSVQHQRMDTLRVLAAGMVFGRTPLTLDLRAAIGDSTDRMRVEAHVGRLSFPTLNRVLPPLTGLATPEGRLDTLIMRMGGGDRSASASCWMRYDGLKVEVRPSRREQDPALFDPVFDALLNAIVKRERKGHRKDDGWTNYTVERRRDRAVFNYLWAGVREGAKASMLPGVVLNATSNKSRSRGK
ncbi:MAG TPA: hypothetical protein PLL57_02335 [Flavobacteriales bacterium]|nr:hypothetical protein [Flavobacteriales bacterium]